MIRKIVFIILFFVGFMSKPSAQENAIFSAINNQKELLIIKENQQNKQKNKFFSDWSLGFSYGLTQFDGDIRQFDHVPAYQKDIGFFELKTAFSFDVKKKINPLFYLSAELILGKFAGLNRKYSDVSITPFFYDNPYGGYEGNGEKFITEFIELDGLLLFDVIKIYSYFSEISKKKYSILGRVGIGYNKYHALKTNLFTDTYIFSYGYKDEPVGDIKDNFVETPSATVYIYGLSLLYPLNKKIDLNLGYTVRAAKSDTWDASERKTKVLKDKFSTLMFGFTYSFSSKINKKEWVSPIDGLKDDVTNLFVKIDGFTDDSDNDGVADAFDKNPKTPLGVAVDGSGTALDVDMDNVPDYRDADPFSNRGVNVDENGVEFDDDNDGVPNSQDLESKTQPGTIVNQFGMSISNSVADRTIYFPSVYFNSGSALVSPSNDNRIATIALLLKKNPEIKLVVIGHTDEIGSIASNHKLGLKRANAVIDYLVTRYNISIDRLVAKTRGEEDPLSKTSNINNGIESIPTINSLSEINRRVDFEITY